MICFQRLNNKFFWFKIVFVLILTLNSVLVDVIFLRYESITLANYLFIVISDQRRMLSIYLISIFIFTYDSFIEVYLEEESVYRMSLHSFVRSKFFELSIKVILYFAILIFCVIGVSLFNDSIIFSFSLDSVTTLGLNLASNGVHYFGPLFYVFIFIVKYYLVSITVLMTAYYGYLVTRRDSIAVLIVIIFIVVMNTIGSNGILLSISENNILMSLNMMLPNYHIGTTSIIKATSMYNYLALESLSVVYLALLGYLSYLCCTQRMIKTDIIKGKRNGNIKNNKLKQKSWGKASFK